MQSHLFSKWNDKITTLPGLYLLSTPIFRLISHLFKIDDVKSICSTEMLRLFNVGLATLNFIVIYKIFSYFESTKTDNKASKVTKL